MGANPTKNSNDKFERFATIVVGLPWMEIAAEFLKLTRTLWRGLADEGMYEVLEHESRLEILDKKGKRAKFTKRQKVRYRQNNIIAYQDHAWGDGKILLDYRCTPGKVVDQYRPGHKTFLLISLRESKQRGDEDEFNMEWGIRDGFIRCKELWETEIRHKTKQVKVQIIFPKSRPPDRVWLEENVRQKKSDFDQTALSELPDGRWQLTWQSKNPRLNERYHLHWTW
jgi:hypothetical protein